MLHMWIHAYGNMRVPLMLYYATGMDNCAWLNAMLFSVNNLKFHLSQMELVLATATVLVTLGPAQSG